MSRKKKTKKVLQLAKERLHRIESHTRTPSEDDFPMDACGFTIMLISAGVRKRRAGKYGLMLANKAEALEYDCAD
ncbi:MAG: hypothetical protein AAB421_01985 [Patescibacteria group bacterium]